MKLLVVIFGLFATSWATAPVTPIVKDKLSQCLLNVGLIAMPQIDLDVSILLLGLVHVYVDVDIDCSKIAANINLAVEKSYAETTSGGISSFYLEIQAVALVNLELDASVAVHSVIGLHLGTCVLVYVDLVADLMITGTFPVGQPSKCKITNVVSRPTHSDSHITPYGPPIISAVCSLLGASILASAFVSLQVCVDAVLVAGLV